MVKKFRLKAVLTIMVLGGTLYIASPALANDVPQTAAQLPPTVTMSVSGAQVSASDVATKKVTILANIMANGMSQKTVKRLKSQGQCRWIGAGTNVPGFWNSGRAANGGIFWFWDTRHTYICGNRKVKCGNSIRFVRPESNVVTGKVIMVRSFAHLKVRINLLAQAKATCTDNPNTWALGSASLTQTVELRLFVKTKGASTVRLYGKLVDKAGVNAQAKVQCESVTVTVTPPPSNQPPPTVQPKSSPPSATVDFVQEIDASDFSVNPQITYTAPIRVHVSAPSGDSLTVTLTVRYGSWPQHNSVQTLTSTGTDLVTATYQSPTESGVKEQVKAVVFDNTTRLSTTAYSNEFDVVQPPAPPA